MKKFRSLRRLITISLILHFTFSIFNSHAAIPMRGVVEGYYGRPWGTEGRISLMKFMGENDMNTFIYGPKDDPYHHHRWREEYPTEQADDFRKLLAVAKENKINFYWAIHLGGAFDGGEKDYAALFAKLESMYQIGLRAFAVFFDDYGKPDAVAHAETCNRILREFIEKKGDCAPLIMCPNHYWGTGDKYQLTLGEKLDLKVNVMWTGRAVCSNVTKADVEKITKVLRRPPFVWWNWPVTDYCRRKLLLGRTYGCEPAEYAGFVSNPMENCEANKIALYGVAAWCRDPENFDSEANWNAAFTKLYSPKIAEAMKTFARHNSDQGPSALHYRREESVGVTDWDAELKKIRAAVKTLKTELPTENPRLLWEIEGWLDVQDYQAQIAELAFGLKDVKTENGKKPLFRRIVDLRKLQTAAGEKAREKFAAATFERDRRKVRTPVTAAKVLEPMIRKAILEALLMPNAGNGVDVYRLLSDCVGDTEPVARPFGKTKFGEKAHLYTLFGKGGLRMEVSDYGGKVSRLWVPDAKGELVDVTIGFDAPSGWEKTDVYFGAIIGRVGNRISEGRFTLDGKEYVLDVNDADHHAHLHGGERGWHTYVWNAKPFTKGNDVGIVFTRTSPDGEAGYPGAVAAKVTYTITPENVWRIEYEATTDKPTPVNLTHHIYFNLDGSDTILDQELQIAALKFTPCDANLKPTGPAKEVAGTPFDFREFHRIGERIDAPDTVLQYGPGYDHNWVLDGSGFRKVAEMKGKARRLEVWTDQIGLQFYAGNFIDNAWKMKDGRQMKRRSFLALETQHFPDSPNRSDFPSIILKPGETYRTTTEYRFR